MNKLLVTLLLSWVGLTNAVAATGRELPVQQKFLSRVVRSAQREMDQLETRNRLNDQRGESHLNQYLVYIDCRTLAGNDPWVGSISSQLSDSHLRLQNLNTDIVNKFDKVHNLNGTKKARFYILFVANYPVFVSQNTNISSYAALKASQPEKLTAAEEKAQSELAAAIGQIYQRAGSLKTYDHWVAYTTGTLVVVRNATGGGQSLTATMKGFGHLACGGQAMETEKAQCYLRTHFSSRRVSKDPFERLQIRAGDMIQLFSQTINKETVYQEFACGQGGTGSGGQGNLTVNNYSSKPLNNAAALALMLQGKRPIPDAGGRQRHTTQVQLYLTDEDTRLNKPALYGQAERYAPSGDMIKIWLHHDGSKWMLKSGLPNSIQSLAGLYQQNGHNLSVDALLTQLQSNVSDTQLDKICTGLYEFFDWVGKGVEKLRIPEYVWNNEHAQYDPIYATVYRYATLPMVPLREAAQLGINRMKEGDADLRAKLQHVDLAQIEFAALCGVWNGAVDILGAVPQLLSFVTKFGSGSGLEKLKTQYEHLSGYQREENGQLVSQGILGALKDGVKDSFDPTQPCKFAHNTSGIILGIAITIVQPEFVEAVLGKVGATFFNILKVLDTVGEKLNPLSYLTQYTGKFVGKAGSAAYTVVSKAGKKVLYKLDNGFFVARLYLNSVQEAKWVSLPEGQLVAVTDQGGIYQVTTQNGYNGYKILPSVEDVLDEALKISQSLREELVAKGISLSRLQELLAKVSDAEKPSLANALNQVTVGDIGKFAKDLKDNQQLFDYFRGKGVLGAERVGDAWEAINRPQMRKDAAILESVSKLLANNGDFVANNRTKFDKILENLGTAGARCRTCPSPGNNAGLRYVDEIIADLDLALTKFKTTEGFDKLLTEMAASGEKADGGAFLLQVLQTRGDNFTSQVQSFEKFYLSGERFEADIQLTSGKLIEFKSWGKDTWYNLNRGSSFEQLKAYFKSGNDFDYVSNKAKLTGAGVSDPLKYVQERFQSVFKQNDYGIFEDIWVNKGLVNKLGMSDLNKADAKELFIDMVDKLENTLFAFIKTE